MKKIVFSIHVPEEPAAGMIGLNDTITVAVDSGDFGGDKGEFEDAMKEFLVSWYDTPRVVQVADLEGKL